MRTSASKTRRGRNPVVAAARDQVSCDLAGEAAILSLRSNTYYTLNPVGARVWSLLQQPTTVPQLCDTLCSEYDVAPERLQRDITRLVERLQAEGLVDGTDARDR